METINKGVLPEELRPIEERKFDYVAGVESPIKDVNRVLDSNWTPYSPFGRRQYVAGKYDFMNCTHYSANQDGEMFVKYYWINGMLSQECIDFLKKNYCPDGTISTFETSKCFNSILGGNTKKGNWFSFAWDSARKDGLIPYTMLPDAGNTWEEYHNPQKITQEMRDIGKKFLEYFEIFYDQPRFFDANPFFTPRERLTLKELLRQCPINIGIPAEQVGHSLLAIRADDTSNDNFDHYEPFLRKKDNRSIGITIRGVVLIKEPPKPMEKPKHYFAKDLQIGSKGDDVKALQECLIYLGFLKKNLNTGNFYVHTEKAVKDLQEKNADVILKPIGKTKGTGIVGPRTRNYLNNYFK